MRKHEPKEALSRRRDYRTCPVRYGERVLGALHSVCSSECAMCLMCHQLSGVKIGDVCMCKKRRRGYTAMCMYM